MADPNVLFVGAEVPDAQATLFLFADEPTGGSLSLAPFTCPEGTTAETLDSAACTPAAGTFDLTITSTSTAESQALADATQAPGSPFYTWSGLPLGDYAIAVPSMPPGFSTFTIPDLTIDTATNTYVARLTGSAPEVQLNIFFLPDDDAAGGSISVAVFDCPPGMSRDTLVPAQCRPSTGFDLNLYPPTGGALGLNDATVQGHVVTWSDLPYAEYALEEVVLPPGYTEAFAEAPTSRLSDRVYVATISESTPQAEFALYNLQNPASVPAPTPAGSG